MLFFPTIIPSLFSYQNFLNSLFAFQKVTLWKKVHVIYSFFFVRKIIAHIVTFIFYCLVIPMTVLVPEVEIPKWGAVYIPSIITLLNSVGTPRSASIQVSLSHLSPFWVCSWTLLLYLYFLFNHSLSHRSLHLLVFWILFENVMSLHRTKATLIGLLEAGRVNEWVVTEKLGDALKIKPGVKVPRKPRFKFGDR